MSAVKTEHIASFDGTALAVHRVGEGRPVFLLHGLFSSAEMNWIRFGHAAKLAEAGFEAIMPDLRAHGGSASPHDPVAYPPGVLVGDVEAVAEELGLAEFDLVGFSLGARTAAAAVVAGLAPRRLVLAIPSHVVGLPEALAMKRPRGRTVAYVCRGPVCSEPIERLDALSASRP